MANLQDNKMLLSFKIPTLLAACSLHVNHLANYARLEYAFCAQILYLMSILRNHFLDPSVGSFRMNFFDFQTQHILQQSYFNC